jgi:hypothetical protein
MRHTRRAASLVEVVVFGAIGLSVIGGALGLLAAARRHDSATDVRLDGAAAITLTLEKLRRDVTRATAIVTHGTAGLDLALAGQDVSYRWRGPGRPLERQPGGGRNHALSAFSASGSAGLVVLELVAPGAPAGSPVSTRPTGLLVPMLAPTAALRARYGEWDPDGRAEVTP